MGFYIDPKNTTKEQWLHNNADKVTQEVASKPPEGYLPVVWMDNGPFAAAGIAFSPREFQAFTLPSDLRPKRYYLAKKSLLKDVNPYALERIEELPESERW